MKKSFVIAFSIVLAVCLFAFIGCGDNAQPTPTADGGCDHVWLEWVITKQPTCSAKGEESRTCSLCGKTEKYELQPTDHVYGEWQVTETATCTKSGMKEKACRNCDHVEKMTIEKTSHQICTQGDCLLTYDETANNYVATCSLCGNDVDLGVDFFVNVEEDRDVKVLQLSDMQIIDTDQDEGHIYDATHTALYRRENMEANFFQYARDVIIRTNPDFIIITGDLVYGRTDNAGTSLLALIDFMDSFEIPWSPVFGNHDNESAKGVDWQCEQLEKSEYCLFKQRTLTGNGNYNVGVICNGKLVRVFYMLDSNGCSAMSQVSFDNGHSQKSYGFGSDQINWYKESIGNLKKLAPSVRYSMAFHAQLAVFGEAFSSAGYVARVDLNTYEGTKKGDFGFLGAGLKNPWDDGQKVWGGIVSLGVDSIFVGHEHLNSASVVYQGVRLQYGQKSSIYDRANYVSAKTGEVVGSYYPEGEPIVGGTLIPLSSDGTMKQPYLVLFGKDIDDGVDVEKDYILDFDGEKFDTVVGTATLKDRAVAEKSQDKSSVPSGYTGEVYVAQTTGENDEVSVAITFDYAVSVDKLKGLYVKMFVERSGENDGKVKIFNNSAYVEKASQRFEKRGGVYGEWVEINVLPLLKTTDLVSNGKLQSFVFAFEIDSVSTVYLDGVRLSSTGTLYQFE